MAMEFDAVVRVSKKESGVVYLGSSKTYSNGIEDARSLTWTMALIANTLNSASCPASFEVFRGMKLKGAFMAESLGYEGRNKVPGYCKENRILLLTRSDGSIVRSKLRSK
jgi:hypothetical protein